jgi:hypothetical protein
LQDTSKDLLVLVALFSNGQECGLQAAVLALNYNIAANTDNLSLASLVVVLKVLVVVLKK